MKREKGITLIALVITIIVLLILAGISISLVIGNNGVLTQATNAVETNRDAKAKEEVEMAWAGATADYWHDWAGDSSTTVDADFYARKLNTYLADTKNEEVEVTDNGNGTYAVEYVTKDQQKIYTFLIDENGKAHLLKGNAAEIASNYTNIGKKVNYGVSYTGSDNGWQILYADNKNVYIISTGYANAEFSWSTKKAGAYTGITTSDGTITGTVTGDFKDTLNDFPAVKAGWLEKLITVSNGVATAHYVSAKENMRASEYLLDSGKVWNELYKDQIYADWAIGGPTLEMIVASYNTVNVSNKKTIGDLVTNGYQQTFANGTLPVDLEKPWNQGFHYWIAMPSWRSDNCVSAIDYTDQGVDSNGLSGGVNYRPVVCLKSYVVLSWDEVNNRFNLDI